MSLARGPGDELRVQAPRCAAPFVVHTERPRTLLIGDEVGIASVLFLAERLREPFSGVTWKPLVLMGSESLFPFRSRPSSIIVSGIPPFVIACMPLLEEWGVPNRLASKADFPGCFEGLVSELADAWLGSLRCVELAEVEIFSCGSAALLDETRGLAGRYGVPCQRVGVSDR
jgi:dihydroorotate dehydrogenase electron transfer subunit